MSLKRRNSPACPGCLEGDKKRIDTKPLEPVNFCKYGRISRAKIN